MQRCEDCGCIVHTRFSLTVKETRLLLVRVMFLVLPGVLFYWRITRMPFCTRCRRRVARSSA